LSYRKAYVGCIVYADDVLLLSASVVHLGYNECMTYVLNVLIKLDIVFNATKSTLFKVGKVCQEKLDNLYILGRICFAGVAV